MTLTVWYDTSRRRVHEWRCCGLVWQLICTRQFSQRSGWVPTCGTCGGTMPPVSPARPLVWEVIDRLDGLSRSVTDFEASVLETMLRTKRVSPKQLRIVCQMAERYLPDGATLSAELAG